MGEIKNVLIIELPRAREVLVLNSFKTCKI